MENDSLEIDYIQLKRVYTREGRSEHVDVKFDYEANCILPDCLIEVYEFLRKCGWSEDTIDKYLMIPQYNISVDEFKQVHKKKGRKKNGGK